MREKGQEERRGRRDEVTLEEDREKADHTPTGMLRSRSESAASEIVVRADFNIETYQGCKYPRGKGTYGGTSKSAHASYGKVKATEGIVGGGSKRVKIKG